MCFLKVNYVRGLDIDNDFASEKYMFQSAKAIETYLFAASFLAKSSNGLSGTQTPTSAVNGLTASNKQRRKMPSPIARLLS